MTTNNDKATMKNERSDKLDWQQNKRVRNAIAAQIARDVNIPQELIDTRVALDNAANAYRVAVGNAVQEFFMLR